MKQKFLFPLCLIIALNLKAQTNKIINKTDLPTDFPNLTINIVNNPTPGFILYAPQDRATNSHGNYLIILDENGNVYRYKNTNETGVHDFKVQPNGLITWALDVDQGGVGQQAIFYIADSTLTVIDSVKAVGFDSLGNKLIADGHEFFILPNGNYLFTIKVPQITDMTQYGGKSNATVVHGMIQELDINKNVVWEWRSWDHIPITDTDNLLTLNNVRLNHFNTLDVTPQGTYLMGNRVNAEAINIDRKTGDILWRFGGRDNQFTFIAENDTNSPNYFSAHDVRMLPNGNITLFDNGNNHNTWFSRAVEYQINYDTKTATKIWEYRHAPDILSRNQGSTQKLSNGNFLISWGGNQQDSTSSDITEVKSDGTVTFDLTLPKNSASYRAIKYNWNIFKPTAAVTQLNVTSGTTYDLNNNSDSTGVKIKVISFNGPETNKLTLKKYNLSPLFPQFNERPDKVYKYRYYLTSITISSLNANLEFMLSTLPEINNPSKIKVYFRSTIGEGLFTPLTTVYDSLNAKLIVNNSGFGEYIFADEIDVVTGIKTKKTLPQNFLLKQNYPNPFNPSTIINYQLPKISKVTLTVYDVLGKEVAKLVNQEQSAGTYKVNFDASHLSSGIYFYTLIAGDFVQTKKLVLLK